MNNLCVQVHFVLHFVLQVQACLSQPREDLGKCCGRITKVITGGGGR